MATKEEMTAEVREAINTYMRRWSRSNSDKTRAHKRREWAKKARKTQQKEQQGTVSSE